MMRDGDYVMKKMQAMVQKQMDAITDDQVNAFLKQYPVYFTKQIETGRFKGKYAICIRPEGSDSDIEVFDGRYFTSATDAIKDAMLILEKA